MPRPAPVRDAVRSRPREAGEALGLAAALSKRNASQSRHDGIAPAPRDTFSTQGRWVTLSHSEADARIAIDDRLRQAGWDLRDKSMVGTEIRTVDSSAADADLAPDP